jgi:dihydropteroate synthase
MEPSTTTTRALRCGNHNLTFGRIPLVTGILNVTPDSFSDGGSFDTADKAIEHAHAMARDGAAMIDIGGESTRPGSKGVSAQEEIDRVLPVVEALVGTPESNDIIGIPVSVDTRKPQVARAALLAGAHVINDVSAAEDPEMVDVLREAGGSIPVVIMHMKGSPESMQDEPYYDDVVAEVAAFLGDRAARLEASGIDRGRIVIDPGIGFGKRVVDNLDLLKNVDALRELGYPVLIGASRKAFIGKLLDRGANERLWGSLAVVAQCYDASTEMIRVHDVRETMDMLRVIDAIRHPELHRGRSDA